MNYVTAFLKLQTINQEHLMNGWNNLTPAEQNALLKQIENLNVETFKASQTIIKHPSNTFTHCQPYREYGESGNPDDYRLGKELIAHGKTGCLIVAGGQGTRLGFEGPKGIFPLTRVKRKTLFQLFAEKTAAASKQANTPLPLAIMTSPLNDAVTKEYFAQNRYFGLLPEQLFFFTQDMLPYLDLEGNLFLEAPGLIAQGPDGNGNTLRKFYESGIWEQWNTLGIEQLLYIQIDNPLADPFDAELCGFHHRTKADITLKCVFRQDPQEKVGVVVRHGKQIEVVEYTELPAQEKEAISDHRVANISLFAFSMRFIEQCKELELPLHASLKPAKPLAKAWKMETFIFDHLPYAANVQALLYPRSDCFAPLKSSENVEEVQNALQESDIKIAKSISHAPPPKLPFELAQDFYYPTPYLLSVWENRPFPDQPYIAEGS